MPRYSKTEIEENRAALQEMLPPGSTVYASVNSRSGTSHAISLHFVDVDREIVNVSWRAARVLGLPLKDGAIVVSGYGMDMGFHIVAELSYALHGRDNKGTGVNGHPRTVDPDNFRAGYSLIKRDL